MGKAWADKEHAQENQYFSKQEAANLAKLASKLEKLTSVRHSLLFHSLRCTVPVHAFFQRPSDIGFVCVCSRPTR